MTLKEFSQMPKGLTMAKYEKLLQEKKRLKKQVEKLSGLLDFESDAINILKDEVGSERYKKHIEQMQQYTTERDKALKRLAEIETVLNC